MLRPGRVNEDTRSALAHQKFGSPRKHLPIRIAVRSRQKKSGKQQDFGSRVRQVYRIVSGFKPAKQYDNDSRPSLGQREDEKAPDGSWYNGTSCEQSELEGA
ncbi:hypothetical protein [Paenibacillus lacisoli]|uniref:hypothetical protein n=1 Tax=Paenibacillus lacisoli TaxID=3064525 RepID=UPI0027298006|nr:hypothetical protein [Paenibacillus sp. JX-17]